DEGAQDLLIAPELAKLHVLIHDAVGMELVHKALDLRVALVYLVAGHEPRALVPVEVVAADGVVGAFAGGDVYALPAREAAEAVAVRHNHGAAHLDELGEVRVVYLGADHDYAGAEGELRLRFAGLYLLQRFLYVGEDELVRTHLAD